MENVIPPQKARRQKKKAKRHEQDQMNEDRKIFVGGLLPETTSQTLKSYFSKFGKVDEVRIIGEKKKKPRGYGFITFNSDKVVLEVLAKSHTIEGVNVDVNSVSDKKKPKHNTLDVRNKVFIPSLPNDCTKPELHDFFSSFGDISEILLVVRKNKERCFGFVKFSDHQSAENVLKRKTIEFRNDFMIDVEPAVPKEKEKVKRHAQIEIQRAESIRDNDYNDHNDEEVIQDYSVHEEHDHLRINIEISEKNDSDSYCSITKKISARAKQKSGANSVNEDTDTEKKNLRFNEGSRSAAGSQRLIQTYPLEDELTRTLYVPTDIGSHTKRLPSPKEGRNGLTNALFLSVNALLANASRRLSLKREINYNLQPALPADLD